MPVILSAELLLYSIVTRSSDGFFPNSLKTLTPGRNGTRQNYWSHAPRITLNQLLKLSELEERLLAGITIL